MFWRGRQGSSNVEDRRGFSPGGLAAGGGVISLIFYIIYSLMGGDPSQLQQVQQNQPGQYQSAPGEDTMAQFVSVVLKETEDVWTEIFSKMGRDYPKPVMVLFSGSVQSACGMAGAASGPFYCPGDNKLYIDLSFYRELRDRFGAGGDFAMAYVIAHEVGHHVQTLLGTMDKMDELRGRLSETEYNKYSVKLELQADFYAGVWAHYASQIPHNLEAGDIDEALTAANAIGDDRLQKESQGYVVPDAFTHGTSQQRVYWFKRGFDTGDLSQGNTFGEEI